jgi:soluble lytic murein transglycosylase-like protein
MAAVVSPRGHSPGAPSPLRLLWVLVLLLAQPSRAAWGEIVVLTGGDLLKVDSYQLDGERMRLRLRGGGALTLALGRIERIIDDEVTEEPVPEQPAFSVVFRGDAAAPKTPYGELFLVAARRHGLNPDLLAAVARAESAFDPAAISVKGARGLMQLMPATADRFGVEAGELFDPQRNLEAAGRYLDFLRDRFDGDLSLMLAAYNAGEGAVARHRGVPPYRETRQYIERVFRYLGL